MELVINFDVHTFDSQRNNLHLSPRPIIDEIKDLLLKKYCEVLAVCSDTNTGNGKDDDHNEWSHTTIFDVYLPGTSHDRLFVINSRITGCENKQTNALTNLVKRVWIDQVQPKNRFALELIQHVIVQLGGDCMLLK